LEVLICDLNMPEMDGVELIRKFGQTGFKGGLSKVLVIAALKEGARLFAAGFP
jgi:CheY-like chemotaxis protein